MAESYLKKILGEDYKRYTESRVKIRAYLAEKLLDVGNRITLPDLLYLKLFDYEVPVVKHSYRVLFFTMISQLKKKGFIKASKNLEPTVYTVILAIDDITPIIGSDEAVQGSLDYDQEYKNNRDALKAFTLEEARKLKPGDAIQVTFLTASLTLPHVGNGNMKTLYYNYIAGFFRAREKTGLFKSYQTVEGRLCYRRTDKPWPNNNSPE